MVNYILYYIDESIFIGIITRSKLRTLVNSGDISLTESNKFFKSVRAFYVLAMEYALKNLPLNDDLLKKASFVNLSSQNDVTFSQVEYFVDRYSVAIAKAYS